jgi:LysR family transcriptional regulator, nod-box dependent transcriptional activator
MRFDRLDLNLLRVLNVLLVEPNVTRAAARLSVTQQAVSNSLRRLRQEFDDPLLVRVGHGMQLTPLAASLLEPLRESLLRLEIALSQRPSFDPATTARTFRVAMPHYHSFVLLPQTLRTLAAEAPLISLQVQVATPSDFAALEHGDIDLLAIEDSMGRAVEDRCSDKIHRHLLLQDDFVCLIDQSSTEPHDELTPERYERLPHCVMRPTPETRMQVERGWEKLGVAPRVAAVAPGYAVMVFTLRGTGLVATVPRRLARVFAHSLGLRVYECPIPLESLRGEARWHQRNDDDPVHAYLRSVLHHVAEQEDERNLAYASARDEVETPAA